MEEKTIRLMFERAWTESQQHGNVDDYLLAYLTCRACCEGIWSPPFTVELRQTSGATYADAALESFLPKTVRGYHISQVQFTKAAEAAYRNLIGESGRCIEASRNFGVTIEDCHFIADSFVVDLHCTRERMKGW
jgi:hypothetical protein